MTNVTVSARITVQRVTVPTPVLIKRVRKWGDPVLIDLLAADVNLIGTTNFQAVQLSTVDRGRAWFGAVSQFQPSIDREYLRSIQKADASFTVQQKMNWMGEGSTKGRPYFEKSSGLAFGTIVFGGQLIEIDPQEYRFKCQYPNRDKDDYNQLFYRINGFRKADIGKGYTYATHPHLIQRATAAYDNNHYEEFPRGEIFHPVWDCRDWPANERDGILYIAAAFLEAS